jgi:hypothetical protein
MRPKEGKIRTLKPPKSLSAAFLLRTCRRSWGPPHLGAASKCAHWRSIDLADLKRMGLLKPIVGGRIRAITWKRR